MGVISSTPAGITCGATCDASFVDGTVVTLTAASATNSDFGGWVGGGCSGTGPCVVTMTAATTVRATFTLKTWPLTVSVSGSGSVSSTPAGINCGTLCSKVYADGTSVTLVPSPGAGAMFGSWGGACSGSGTCIVTMNQARSVTAAFVAQVVGVAVLKVGTGSGTVSSTPAGISCGSTCSAPYAIGTVVTLSAVGDATSDFSGWSGGGCSGTGTCVVTVAAATSVTATFTLKTWQLSVTAPVGTGSGVVTSSPLGINCGAQCSKFYDHGTMVTLTASASMGSSFTGWGGACLGVGSCVVTMDQARSVTASFVLQTFVLTITKSGAGTGGVTSPAGINCGPTCSATLNDNTVVTLTATPAANATFAGWSGAGCSGTGTCVVTMTAAQTVNAKFDPIQLDVLFSGNGVGTVNSAPTGINGCGPGGIGICSASYGSGTVVVLTATPEATSLSRLSTFVGWSGACSGSGSCTVTMNASTSVTAQFALKPNMAFVTNNTTNGAFGGNSGGDMLCANAASLNGLAGTYRAMITTSGTSSVSRLGTASGWVRVDSKPLANTAAEAANGNFFNPLRISNTGADVGDDGVWTASFNTAASCLDFTSTTGSATTGRSSGVGTMAINPGGTGCTVLAHLYCFGVDRAAAVGPVVASPRRLAFISSGWTPGGGLANADAFCQTEAVAAGLTGNYLAMLATTSASAASRFNIAGPRWTRVDGVPLAATASAMFGPTYWDMVPNMNASQTQVFGNYGVWGGAPSPTVIGTSASTCNNWMSMSGSGIGGRAGYTLVSAYFAFDMAIGCSLTNYALTCLQQ